MYSRNLKIAALAVGVACVVGTPARAATIDYIFTGTATGTLNNTAFSGAFQVELVSDTTTATGVGLVTNIATSATFTIGASTGSLLGNFNEVGLNQDPNFPRIIFGQAQSASPFFVAEGIENSVFVPYDLASAFPLTTGTVSQTAGSLYFTSLGDLVFSDITSMSFEAVIPGATPLPGAMPLFATGLSALGFLGWRRKKKATTAAAK